MSKSKGFLLMALGHSNYGKMALQLAVSLKNTCPGVPIALIYTASAISDIGQRVQLSLYFDEMILAPEYIYTRAGKTEYIKAKTYLYDMSPWDTTIFLDADMIAFPSRSMAELFQELDAHDFTIQNRGFIDLAAEKLSAESYWVDLYELKAALYKISGIFGNCVATPLQ
jgi:alpha-N-acetylglucosamine transferase